ncbi:hypothetical protein Tco_1024104 [Tanacetum coccineum]
MKGCSCYAFCHKRSCQYDCYFKKQKCLGKRDKILCRLNMKLFDAKRSCECILILSRRDGARIHGRCVKRWLWLLLKIFNIADSAAIGELETSPVEGTTSYLDPI